MTVPPQGPPPGWTPPVYWQPPHGQPPYGQPPYAQPPWATPPPSSNKGLFITLGVIVAICVVGFVGLMIGAADRSDITDEERADNARVARSATDFAIVCQAGSVSNAGPFEKPYTIMAFEQGAGFVPWESMSFSGYARFRAGDDVTAIDVVACVGRVPGTEIKQGSCDIDSGGEQLTVDRYSVDYTVQVRQARTGKLIADLGTVPGPSDRCPFISLFDGESPKIYGAPDTAAVEAKLSEFAGG